MALAASVLGLVILGGGGWTYLRQARKARRAAVEGSVTEAVDEAMQLWGRVRSAHVDDPAGWSEALNTARRAEGLLAGGEAGTRRDREGGARCWRRSGASKPRRRHEPGS